MDEMMSETAFDTRLNVLWERFFALQNHAGADVQEPLHDLMTHPKEELDDASYMKLMYMKGLCYEEQGNKNAARYCAMRMYAIQECMRNPRKKRPRFLDLQGYACSDAMNAFIERYTAFLEETYRGINRRLLMIVGILFLAVFLVLTLFLKIYFIIGIRPCQGIKGQKTPVQPLVQPDELIPSTGIIHTIFQIPGEIKNGPVFMNHLSGKLRLLK